MDINQIISQAEQAHSRGQLVEAESFYKKALNLAANVDALYGLATLKMQQGVLPEALSLFEKASAIQPQALDITFNYILCLKQAGQLEIALQKLNNIVPFVHGNKEFFEPYAQLAYSLSAYQQAIDIISKGQQTSPNLAMVLAQSYIAIQNWTEAISILQQLNQQFTNNYDILNSLAICYGKTLNFVLAIPLFEKIIQLKPTNENYLRLIDLYLLAQDKNAAEQTLQKLKANGFKDLSLTELELKIARLNHDKNNAIALALTILQQSANSSIAWQVIGELGNEENQTKLVDTLVDYFERHEPNNFEDRQNLYTLAKALEKRQQFEQAFNYFNAANLNQLQQLERDGKGYQPQKTEQAFSYLKSIDYPTAQQSKEAVRNIFVVGMPRSGTTLVNRLLSQVDNSVSVNESNGIAALFEQKLFDTRPTEIKDLLINEGQSLSMQYQSFVGVTDKLTIDKMPHNFRFVGPILSTFKHAKIVQMRRNPEDLALSIFSQQFNDYHSYACKQSYIAHAIVQANTLMDFWKNKYPEQVYDLDYQMLVDSPEAEAKKLFEFLSIPWHSAYLNFYQQAVPSFTFSEVQVRQPINTSKIGFSKHYHSQLNEFREAYNNFSR